MNFECKENSVVPQYEREQSSIVCPYDKNHIIHKCRIQRHLLKCSRNYPPNYLEKCPYNATHLMPKADLASHIEECPDRKYVDAERYGREVKKHGSMQSCPPSKAESCSDIYNDIWENIEDKFDDFKSNSSIISDFSMILPRTEKVNRRPRGYPEIMMLDVDEESTAEDMESVTSSMALGRGKFMSHLRRNTKNLPKVGKGTAHSSNEIMGVGASAVTDVEDTESINSGIARGEMNYAMFLKTPKKPGNSSINISIDEAYNQI